jgi:histidinol-phosphatase (PHP family)
MGVGPQPGEYPPGHIEAYVEQAATNGLDEVGFTEHLYRCVEAAPVLGQFWADEPRRDLAADTESMFKADLSLSLEGYVEAVVAAKDRGLPVKLGLEVDFFPETIDAVVELLDPYPWDFLIGAVHWVGGWSVDYDISAYEFTRRGVRRAYEDYFELETQLAASGVVDVLAHVDVVKLFGHVLPEPPRDLYAEVVRAAAESGTAVELSSAGLHKPVAEAYPSLPFLEMFHGAGVPITLASDAHVPKDCGRDADRLIEIARSVGYDEYVVFEQRKPARRRFG